MSPAMNVALAEARVIELAPIPVTPRVADFTGGWVDIRELEGLAMFILHAGPTDAAAETLDARIENADDATGTNAAAVTGGSFPTVDNTAGGKLASLILNASDLKPFVRVFGDVTGGTPTFTWGCTVVGFNKYNP